MFEYDLYAQIAAATLDEYDFTETLRSCYEQGMRTPFEIADEIENKYGGACVEAIDDLDMYEVMEYLSDRYNVRFEEVITYRMCYK